MSDFDGVQPALSLSFKTLLASSTRRARPVVIGSDGMAIESPSLSSERDLIFLE